MLIDTHCHIHDAASFPDPEAEIRLADEAGVGGIIVVGVNPLDWSAALELAEAHDRVFAAIGWHPNYTADYDSSLLDELRALLSHPKVLALGEIGLDYHWNYSPRETQYRALLDQLALAAEMDMPVVFHSREAYADLLTVLEGQPSRPYLFHCFAGDQSDAERAIALGCYFGVDGPVTYKKADDLRDVVQSLPRNRVVVETDSPYLTPVPHRGKPNRPAYVRCVAAGLASIWGVTEEEAAIVTTENARRFFRIDESLLRPCRIA